MGRPRTKYNFTNVPTSWNEISLKKFQELTQLYEDDNTPSDIELIAFFCNVNKNYIKDAPIAVVNEVMNYMSFINTPIDEASDNKIVIDNEQYQINTQDDLKFGEYVDIQTVIQNDKNNLAAMLGILCRKEGEVYDDDYIAKILPKRIEMFESLPITAVQPLINFFARCLLTSAITTQQFSLQKLVSQQAELIEHSLKNGVGKKHSLVSRQMILRKLKKYKKIISQL